MKFEIVGKNVEISDQLRERIEKKLSGLEKYLSIDEDTTARVVAKVYPTSQKVEITIPSKVGVLRAEVVEQDFNAAVDLAIDKLEDQVRRQKTRLSRRHKEHLAVAFANEELAQAEEEDIPVKTKTIVANKMSLDEAIMQMELSGHNFYIYTDDEDENISVVYRRSSGGYGLIETEKE